MATLPPSDTIAAPSEALAHYAGESATAATEILPAADVVHQIAGGCEALLTSRIDELRIEH